MSDLQSYDYFGDIIAGEEGLECLVLENPDDYISINERHLILQDYINKHDGLKYIIQNRYKLDHRDLHKY